jgi:hypothetical protein
MRAVQLQPGERNYCAEFHIAVSLQLFRVPMLVITADFRLPTRSPAISSSVTDPNLYSQLRERGFVDPIRIREAN